MIKVRWFRPERLRGKESTYEEDRASRLLMNNANGNLRRYNGWAREFNNTGYIYLLGRKAEFVMWDDTQINPDKLKELIGG